MLSPIILTALKSLILKQLQLQFPTALLQQGHFLKIPVLLVGDQGKDLKWVPDIDYFVQSPQICVSLNPLI